MLLTSIPSALGWPAIDSMRFVVFFAIFFSVCGSANYSVFVRGRLFFPGGSWAGTVLLPAFPFVAVAYLAGRMLQRYVTAKAVDWCPLMEVI